MKLAISYALSQSVKLSVYENRVVDIVEETKNLPGERERGGITLNPNQRLDPRPYCYDFPTTMNGFVLVAPPLPLPWTQHRSPPCPIVLHPSL